MLSGSSEAMTPRRQYLSRKDEIIRLAQEHPDWDTNQIVKAVSREVSSNTVRWISRICQLNIPEARRGRRLGWRKHKKGPGGMPGLPSSRGRELD